MIDIEADEAVVTRPRERTGGVPLRSPGDATWIDVKERPMELHLKGNVVLRQDQNGTGPKSGRRIIRAAQLDYDFATDHLTAVNAEVGTVGLHPPSRIEASRIELTGFLTRQPARSPAPGSDRASHAEQSKSQ